MVESGSMRTNIFAEIGRHIEQRLGIMVIPGITAFDAPAVCNMGSTTAGQDRRCCGVEVLRSREL
jgi:precorrin-2 methylase